MTELHSNGKTTDDIANVLKKVPIHPQIITAVKAAHALGYVLMYVHACFDYSVDVSDTTRNRVSSDKKF